MIGAPVTKVRTPPLLAAFLTRHGSPATVEARHIDPGDLGDFMTRLKTDSAINGLVVTMPHKQAVIPFLHTLSAAARQVGSVNAVKRLPSGQLAGAQFDGAGLVNALLAKDVALASARVLLAGIGGAGLAIARAVARHGCQSLTLTDTDPARIRAAREIIEGDLGFAALHTQLADHTPYDLLINATPLGMDDADRSPFSPELVSRAPTVADIVADPPQTRLAAMATDAGCTLITGRDMVIGQVEPIGRWLLSEETE